MEMWETKLLMRFKQHGVLYSTLSGYLRLWASYISTHLLIFANKLESVWRYHIWTQKRVVKKTFSNNIAYKLLYILGYGTIQGFVSTHFMYVWDIKVFILCLCSYLCVCVCAYMSESVYMCVNSHIHRRKYVWRYGCMYTYIYTRMLLLRVNVYIHIHMLLVCRNIY